MWLDGWPGIILVKSYLYNARIVSLFSAAFFVISNLNFVLFGTGIVVAKIVLILSIKSGGGSGEKGKEVVVSDRSNGQLFEKVVDSDLTNLQLFVIFVLCDRN